MSGEAFTPRPRMVAHRRAETTTTFPVDFREMAPDLRRIAAEVGVSRSELVRQCVRFALAAITEEMSEDER